MMIGRSESAHSKSPGADGRNHASDASLKLASIGQTNMGVSGGGHMPERRQDKQLFIVIDCRNLMRECFVKSLGAIVGEDTIRSHASFAEFLSDDESRERAGMVLLFFNGTQSLEEQINQLEEDKAGLKTTLPPVAIFSENEDIGDMLLALEKGAKAFIPTSVTLEIAAEALNLVRAGGTFVPASSLILARAALNASDGEKKSPLAAFFTERQAAVVEAVRQGKANKTIAYELGMHESTVKVHVRNIMKKLNARNRTQVAYLTENLFRDSGRVDDSARRSKAGGAPAKRPNVRA